MAMQQLLSLLQPHVFKRHARTAGMAFFLLNLFIFDTSPALANETDSVQELLQYAESATALERLTELLDELRTSKIPLNEANGDELRQLPWLTSDDVQAILLYRQEHGRINSQKELQPIIGEEKTTALAPYLRYKKVKMVRTATPKAVEVAGSLYNRLFWETTPRKGILNGKYAGANSKMYHRAQFLAPHLSLSLVQEKDIGEPDAADFTSLSVNFYNLGVLERAVLGNYKLTFGQGLLIGQGRFFSKGTDPAGSVRLSAKPLTPYTSSAEEGFLQGAAATVRVAPFDVTAFYSANHLDAIINKSDVMTSFGSSGYHRTELEIGRKDNVVENVSGANVLYRYQLGTLNGKVGGSMLRYSYPYPFDLLEPTAAVSSVSSGTLSSVEADLTAGKLSLFAELASSQHPNDRSWIAGAEYALARGISTVVARRSYGVNYFSPFAGAFAERGDGASNERGNYIGVQAKVNDRLSIGGYYDLFTFPELSNHLPDDSDGRDARLFLGWKQSSLVAWNLQLQHKVKEEQKNQGTSKLPLWAPLPLVTNRVQLDCNLTPNKHLRFRTRGEIKSVVKQYLAGDQSFTGQLISQQIGYSVNKYNIKGRLTLFNATDYDAALYAYEDDLPLTSSLGVYDGHGKSLFVVATWQAMPQMKLAARYETTWYSDRDVYSSGNDERATNAPGSFHLGCLLSF